jgi:hypothetical protein
MREFAQGPGTWTSWLILAAGTELGLWAHGLGLLYALCLAAALAPAWLQKPRNRERLTRGAAAAAVIAMLYLPCLAMVLGRARDWGGSGWLAWDPWMMLQLLGLYAVPHEVLTIGSAVAALVLVLLVKRAVQAGLEQRGWTAERALLLLWWGPPLLAIIVSQVAIPIFLVRTLAATLIPASLAIAGALARAPSQRERFALTAAVVITLIPSTVQIALRPASEPWDEVAAYLSRSAKPGDQVWLYPNDSVLPLSEAGPRTTMRGIPGDYPAVGFKGPIRAGSPAVPSLTSGQAQRVAVEAAALSAPAIWLVTRQDELFDPKDDLAHALGRVRRAGRVQRWGYITVRPYYRR